MINSSHSPSPSIKKWAYQKSPSEVPPKWDEQITTMDNAEILLTLASDPNCPKRAYILKCLYFLVGYSVSKHVAGDIEKINVLLDNVKSSDQVILNWMNRSRLILRDLRKYDYVEWCQGGFVDKDLSMNQK